MKTIINANNGSSVISVVSLNEKLIPAVSNSGVLQTGKLLCKASAGLYRITMQLLAYGEAIANPDETGIDGYVTHTFAGQQFTGENGCYIDIRPLVANRENGAVVIGVFEVDEGSDIGYVFERESGAADMKIVATFVLERLAQFA